MTGVIENQNKKFAMISKELLAVLLALAVQSGAVIWWASNLTTRVQHLETEANKGDRNTKADGLVRDAKIAALVDLVSDCKSYHQVQSESIDQIKEDLAEMRGRHKGEQRRYRGGHEDK